MSPLQTEDNYKNTETLFRGRENKLGSTSHTIKHSARNDNE